MRAEFDADAQTFRVFGANFRCLKKPSMLSGGSWILDKGR
jgi:hypothetical protein